MSSRPIKIAFTDFWHPDSHEAVIEHNPLYRLLAEHFKLELSSTPDFLVYSSFGNQYLRHRCTRIFYTGENQRPNFNECDYAFSFDYPVSERNYRLPLYKLYGYFDSVFEKGQGLPHPFEREFCNFVYSNSRARERLEFLDLLEGYRQVDCGGKLRNNVGGRVPDKLEFLRNYKFTIAFENSSWPGYTTEKMLEALIAGTVPIYWGNPDVGKDFNPECFINCHDFDSFAAVVDHVREVDQDRDRYLAYFQAPAFPGNQPNEFIKTENIITRFGKIFAGSTESEAAGALDGLRFFWRPSTYLFTARRLRERLLGAGR